jgi:hypothetical protein
MSARNRWSRVLIIVGNVAMLIGALDPLEGSLIILPGSGLVALGTFLNQNESRLITYRVTVFLMIAIGVGSLWWLSSVGGLGGTGKYSMWWGLLVLPYLVGWSMGIWGPGSPRWLLISGGVVGLFYLALIPIVLKQEGQDQVVVAICIGTLGLLTVVGSIIRWKKQAPSIT